MKRASCASCFEAVTEYHTVTVRPGFTLNYCRKGECQERMTELLFDGIDVLGSPLD
jgi:hypothetical protein